MKCRIYRDAELVAHSTDKLNCTARGCREPCVVQFSFCACRVWCSSASVHAVRHGPTPLPVMGTGRGVDCSTWVEGENLSSKPAA